MKIPDTPQSEVSRLEALRSLNILDTPAEERFDRLTRLAKRIFDVPIALVSLVDEDRQWFKSCIGLNVSETPRDISFCGHAILGNQIFIVPDTTQDERFSDNPLVLNDPNIRFYAGCPLMHTDGSKLGTLCVIDTKPRFISDEDIEALKDVAALAERELAAVQLATLDELTKISNRRGFLLLAQHSLNICERQKVSASLVYFDLNKFKHINDNFGHAAGDNALTLFAEKMKSTFRNSDVIARIGGDEFVVLLTNAPIEIANAIIARFKKLLDAHNKLSACGYDITCSVGIASVTPDQPHSIESLLREADAAMYKEKHP